MMNVALRSATRTLRRGREFRDAATSATRRRRPLSSGISVCVERNVAAVDDDEEEPRDDDADRVLVESLLRTTSSMIDPEGSNVIAFSGGVDSSVVAALVRRSLDERASSSSSGDATAVLGVSAAVPAAQIDLARRVARDAVGVRLLEIPTDEGTDPTYLANDGRACLACKTHLYSTLRSVAAHARNHAADDENDERRPPLPPRRRRVVLFNGTNADDVRDPTRLGLIAADGFGVRSPLRGIDKAAVRRAARYLGLPNWNHAASPCLRSRLALGVDATAEHLRRVERGEAFVRRVLDLGPERNMRVRLLSGGRAGVELDDEALSSTDARRRLDEAGLGTRLRELGFVGDHALRPFRSGAVAGAPRPRPRHEEQHDADAEAAFGRENTEDSEKTG